MRFQSRENFKNTLFNYNVSNDLKIKTFEQQNQKTKEKEIKNSLRTEIVFFWHVLIAIIFLTNKNCSSILAHRLVR